MSRLVMALGLLALLTSCKSEAPIGVGNEWSEVDKTLQEISERHLGSGPKSYVLNGVAVTEFRANAGGGRLGRLCVMAVWGGELELSCLP